MERGLDREDLLFQAPVGEAPQLRVPRLSADPDAPLGRTEPNAAGHRYRHGTLTGYSLGRCLFLLRRHQEDSRVDFPGVSAGSFLDLILPVWRTGECLLHASRMGRRFDADTVEVEMTWHGLAGRELRALAGPGLRSVMPGRICNDPEVRSRIAVPVAQISDSLPEFVKELVSPPLRKI